MTAHTLVADEDTLCLTPWNVLADQLVSDISERFWRRIGTTAPTDKCVHRLLPSTAASLLANNPAGTVWVATIATLQQLAARDPLAYRALGSRLGLVMVDEGHYEPAPAWAAAVRGLNRPTVLFSATPYRNDLKYFNIDPSRNCYLLSHEVAEKEAYVRPVHFAEAAFGSPESFCDSLLALLSSELPPSPDARVIVRCHSKSTVQDVAKALAARGLDVVAFHDRFTGAGPSSMFRSTVPDPESEHATFWVHQYKLTEGIDSSSFRVVAFYEPFLSERALVQQVGRVIRNPLRDPNEFALVFSSADARLRDSWASYREYDETVSANGLPKPPAETAKLQAAAQYFDGRFRRRFDYESPSVHEDFLFPLAARVYAVPEHYRLEELAQSVTKALTDADCEMGAIIRPGTDTLLQAYYVVGNSPLLARSAFIEYRVGYTIYRKIGRYLFFYDTEGITPEALNDCRPVDFGKLKQLFSGTLARLTSVTLLNSDIGRHSVRRRSLYARSVADLGPDLGDHIQFASTATGFTTADGAGEPAIGRYVGFSRGRVRDSGVAGFSEYMSWLEMLAQDLDDGARSPLAVFDRFAEVVDQPANTTPSNILLDLSQVEFTRSGSGGREPLRIDDSCVSVQDDSFRLRANEQEYEVALSWDEEKRRYRLKCPELDDSFSMTGVTAASRQRSLIAYLNAEQAFRIVPASDGQHCVYVGGRFLKPRLPLGGRSAKSSVDLLELLEGLPELSSISSEKGGKNSATGNGWAPGCLFHLIDSLGVGTGLERRLTGVDRLICDDGGTEIADFLALDHELGRVIGIHAKAFARPKKLSASALHDISSQALKNLGYLQAYDIGSPANLSRWNGPWTDGRAGRVDSRIRRGSQEVAAEIWEDFRAVLRDPRITREVWLVLGQGPSKAMLINECKKRSPRPEALQMLYSLQATWAAVSSVGARLIVFTSA